MNVEKLGCHCDFEVVMKLGSGEQFRFLMICRSLIKMSDLDAFLGHDLAQIAHVVEILLVGLETSATP